MRQPSSVVLALLVSTSLVACGDDGSTSAASATMGGTGTATTPGTSSGTGDGTGPTSGGGSVSEGTGTVSETGTTGTPTTGEPGTDSDGTTTTTTSATTTTGTTSTGPDSDSDSDSTTMMVSSTSSTSTTGPAGVCGDGLLDPGEECDDGDQIDNNACSNACKKVPCDEQMGGGMPQFDFSFIWIANSPQGTVSKVNTATMVEVARYRTDPVANSSPSRTAVNVDGRFAAVANRVAGSVTVFAALEEDCIDYNGNGVIDTSTGPNDVKPWGQDECMLWNKKISPSNNNVEQRGPRPLGWDFADQDPVTCKYNTHTLWMGWYGNQGQGYFWHLDKDGNQLGEVIVPVWGNLNSWGPYGGAVDRNHDFWVAGWHGPLVRINSADYTYDMWNDPILQTYASYGMALDKEGDVWFGGCGGGVITFNPITEQFKLVGTPGGCMRGLMVDSKNRGWIAKNGGACLVQVDTVNDTIVNANINLPGCQTVVGVSIDIEGYVWVVDQGGKAYKVDPDTLQAQVVSGFNGPYTYSDMTGAGIQLQALPQ